MTALYLRDRWFEDLPVGEFHVLARTPSANWKSLSSLRHLIRALSRSTLKRPGAITDKV